MRKQNTYKFRDKWTNEPNLFTSRVEKIQFVISSQVGWRSGQGIEEREFEEDEESDWKIFLLWKIEE